ncbi:MAG: PHP domain-containing protein [bacterium]
MSSSLSYRGTRWFKCDFHIHTTASDCFGDKTVTLDDLIQKVCDTGLNCIAITDHNAGKSIDGIKEIAANKGIFVFPGVEITCDTSKVHLLILFDVMKSSRDIEDFLTTCGIQRSSFGKIDACSTKTILDIAKIANDAGALIIPAHIDSYSGLGSISLSSLDKFYALPYINSAQVVFRDFIGANVPITGNEELKSHIKEFYPNGVEENTLKTWYRPVQEALKSHKTILTFSDNPQSSGASSHGVAGVGSRYTWIKMDEKPSLESLRQALLLGDIRVKNDFDCHEYPYQLPELWIKSISIKEATNIAKDNPLKIDFSPQLSTIIGGRGSGKSSALRFIRGVFNRVSDIKMLADIFNDHVNFYKKTNNDGEGVLNENTEVEIEFVRNKELYKITASKIESAEKQSIKIEKLDNTNKTWTEITDAAFIHFFEFEQYSQKQIYEIAQRPNSLREIIDKFIVGLDQLKKDREVIKGNFLTQSAKVRELQKQVSDKAGLQTQIRDLEDKIKLCEQSGISDLLTKVKQFSSQNESIENFISEIKLRESYFDSFEKELLFAEVDTSVFEGDYKDELQRIFNESKGKIELTIAGVKERKAVFANIRTQFEDAMKETTWQKKYTECLEDIRTKKQGLQQKGINDISNFEELINAKISKERILKQLEKLEDELEFNIKLKEELKKRYLITSTNITRKRKSFTKQKVTSSEIKINIKRFGDRYDFIQKLRSILQKETEFEPDINRIANGFFSKSKKIRRGNDYLINVLCRAATVSDSEAGQELNDPRFKSLISKLNYSQIDEIELLLPDDDIEIKYKPTGGEKYKSLSTVSAGQKTTAILIVILSYGYNPLILDQPEDDLDNRLVYDLIVSKLRTTKESRQIIVVTHNANIPVNGDAEYIISMSAESDKLSVLKEGTIECADIKKEICDVMEGSEKAFDMRYQRYKKNISTM